jgi:hypothetical protein
MEQWKMDCGIAYSDACSRSSVTRVIYNVWRCILGPSNNFLAGIPDRFNASVFIHLDKQGYDDRLMQCVYTGYTRCLSPRRI